MSLMLFERIQHIALHRVVLVALVLGSLTGVSIAGDAKSMYVIANHSAAQFDAWNINAPGVDPPISYQATYGLSYAHAPAGVAIDSNSETLFITSENTAGVELVDAKTMTSFGWSDGASNLGGIDFDETNDTVYSVRRGADDLYVYAWDPGAKTLTLRSGYPKDLPDCAGAFGLALDSNEGVLYVADTSAAIVRVYDADTLEQISTFAPSFAPVGIDVDRQRGLVYTTAPDGACAGVSLGNTLLSRYDLATGIETTVDMGYGGMGVAVDEITGYVYVTGGCSGDAISIWDSNLNPMGTTGDIGDPAGIAIGNASYNPLNLAKNDTVVGQGVYVGQQFAYEITYDNAANTLDATGVVAVDRLPVGLDFVSETRNGVPGTGVYDPVAHTVSWDIGTLAAGYTGGKIEIVVSVNQNASSGTTIYNYCEIDSDQSPLTTVVGGDPDNPNPDDPGTDIIEGSPPIARASDITGQPQTMYADTVYSVTCKYYHSSGRDSLKHCLLQLDHPTKPLTMMWYESTGIYGPWAGEEGANYLTITDVDVTEIANGNEGYELTWRFMISNLWPNAAGAIDFGVFASDDSSLESGWDYDDTDSSFSADTGETSSTLPVALIEQKEELIDQLEHLRRWVEIYGLSIPLGDVLALAGLPDDIDWLGYDVQEARALLQDWSVAVESSIAAKRDEALNRLVLAEQAIARIYGSDDPRIRGAEGLTSDISAVVVDVAELFVKPLRVVQKTNQYLHGVRWLSWLHDSIDGLTWQVQNLLGSALVNSVQAILSCPDLGGNEDVKSLVSDLLEVVKTYLTEGTVQLLDIGGELIGSIGTSAVVYWWYVPATQPAEDLSVDMATFLDGAGGYTGLYEDAVDGIEVLENAVASKSASLHDTLQLLRSASKITQALAQVAQVAGLIPGVGTLTLIMNCINIASTAAYAVDAGFSLAYLLELPNSVEAAVDFSFHPDSAILPTQSRLDPKSLSSRAELVNLTLWEELTSMLGDNLDKYEQAVLDVEAKIRAADLQALEAAMNELLAAEDAVFSTFESIKGVLQGVSGEAAISVPGFREAFTAFLDKWMSASIARMLFVGQVIEWAGGSSSAQEIATQGRFAVRVNKELGQIAANLMQDSNSLNSPAVLVITSWDPMPQVMSTTEAVQIQAELRNVGPSTAPDVEVSLSLDNLTSSMSTTHSVGDVASGETATLTWNLTPIAEGVATVTLEVSAEGAIVPVGVSRVLHVSNNQAPMVQLLNVADTGLGDYIVNWQATDPDGGSSTLSISLALSESTSEEWVVLAHSEANDGSYTWSTEGLAPGSYEIQVMATDPEGATGSSESDAVLVGRSPLGEGVGLIAAPNPVRDDEVAFFYELPANTTEEALLRVFSVSGRQLFWVEIDPMEHRWPSSGFWSPVDEYGVPLANGPYLCVLVTDGRVVSQVKMVIQRQ
jgi:uncharacterized repeat protein (TIGR01451 family)